MNLHLHELRWVFALALSLVFGGCAEDAAPPLSSDRVAESAALAEGDGAFNVAVGLPEGQAVTCDVPTTLEDYEAGVFRTPAVRVVVRCGPDTYARCAAPFMGSTGHVRLSVPLGTCREAQLIEVATSAGGVFAPDTVAGIRLIEFSSDSEAAPLGDVQPPLTHLAKPVDTGCGELPCGYNLDTLPLGDASAAFEIRLTAEGLVPSVVTVHLDTFESDPLMAKSEPDVCTIPGDAGWAESELIGPVEVPLQIIWIDGFTARANEDQGIDPVGPNTWARVGEPIDRRSLAELRAFFGDPKVELESPGGDLAKRLNEALPLDDAEFTLMPMIRVNAAGAYDPAPDEVWGDCSSVNEEVRRNAVRLLDAETKFPVVYTPNAINIYVVDAMLPMNSGQTPPAPYDAGDRGLAGFAFFPGLCCASGPPLIMVGRSVGGSEHELTRFDAMTRLIAHELGHLAGLNHITGWVGTVLEDLFNAEVVHRHDPDEVLFDSTDGSFPVGFVAAPNQIQLFPSIRNVMAGWDASTGVVVDGDQAACLNTSLRHRDGYLRNILDLKVGTIDELSALAVGFVDVPSSCDPQPDRSGPQTDDGCDELVAFRNPDLSAVAMPGTLRPLTFATPGGHAWNVVQGDFAVASVAVSKAAASGSTTRSVTFPMGSAETTVFALAQGGQNFLNYSTASFPLSKGEEVVAILVAEKTAGGQAPPRPRNLSWDWIQTQWDQADTARCQAASYPPYTVVLPAQPTSSFAGSQGFEGHLALTENIWGCPPRTGTGTVRVDSNWHLVWMLGPHGTGM